MTNVLHVWNVWSTDLLMTMSSYLIHLDVGLGTGGVNKHDLLTAGKLKAGGAGSDVE